MIETNIIHCGDSANTLAAFPANSIDLVVTSPPYDDIRDYKGFKFDFPAIAKQLTRTLKDGGVIMWNVADQTIDGGETGTSFRQALHFMDDCGLLLYDTMIYEKSGVPYHHPNRYASIFEYMFVFSKGKPKTINLIADKKNKYAGTTSWGVATFRHKDGSLHAKQTKPVVKEFGVRHNIWRILNAGGQGQKDKRAYKHPATMPEQMAADHIRSWSNEGDIVLDPFMGSGTTAIAAQKLNRRWIGVDISEEYCQLARERVASIPPSLL